MYIVSLCEFISFDLVVILNNIDFSIFWGIFFLYQVVYWVIFKMEGDFSVGVVVQVLFYDLCCLLEKILEILGIEKKKKILLIFVSFWREVYGKFYKDILKIVRLIVVVMLQCYLCLNFILKLFYLLIFFMCFFKLEI